jgi:adenosylmethionine-8-amino-7-oxononanoate aminotransferase
MKTAATYLEAAPSFYCAALGYGHERLTEAATRQLRELPMYPSGMHRTVGVALELADKLAALVPIEDAHVLFSSTGSEANDVAIKLMRYRNVARGKLRRRKVISRWGGYHGGTSATAALGSGRSLHDAFALPMDDYLFVSQPNWPVGRRVDMNARFTSCPAASRGSRRGKSRFRFTHDRAPGPRHRCRRRGPCRLRQQLRLADPRPCPSRAERS